MICSHTVLRALATCAKSFKSLYTCADSRVQNTSPWLRQRPHLSMLVKPEGERGRAYKKTHAKMGTTVWCFEASSRNQNGFRSFRSLVEKVEGAGSGNSTLTCTGGARGSAVHPAVHSLRSVYPHHGGNQLAFLGRRVPHDIGAQLGSDQLSTLHRQIEAVLVDPFFAAEDVATEIESGSDRKVRGPVDSAGPRVLVDKAALDAVVVSDRTRVDEVLESAQIVVISINQGGGSSE